MAEQDLSDSEFNEVEDFDEYNPHPYQGGYDIARTYGKPLPATPDICYPLSSASTPARVPAALPEFISQEKPPPLLQDANPEPEPLFSVPPSLPPPLPDDSTSEPAIPADAADPWPCTDPQGNWYVAVRWLPSGCGNCFSGVSNNCKDGQWQLDAADYLFGYLPTWGRKRAETHTYANLNYAYERHWRQQAVSEVVDSEAKHAVLSDSWFSSEDFLPQEELHYELLEWTHAYQRPTPEKPISIAVQPYQLYSEASFGPIYEEQSYPQNIDQYALEWHNNKGNIDVKDEPSWPGSQYPYESHTCHNPISVDLQSYESSEAYEEDSCQQSLHSYALEWYKTQKPIDSEAKISLPKEWIYENPYHEEVHQYSDGSYPCKLLASEKSVSIGVQPVLSESIYHGMYHEERYPSLDDSIGYANSSYVYTDPAEKLWSQLVNEHKDVNHHQHLVHNNMREPNHEQQVWEAPVPCESAWFWNSQLHQMSHGRL